MLQLMSPAGSLEAVIAAVQSGCDIVYIGTALTEPEGGEDHFAPDQLARAFRYCRARGCRCVLSLGPLASDEGLDPLCRQAVFAAQNGADAIMVQDLGLGRVLRSLLPETPLWGDVRMGVSTRDGVLAAAALGFSRVTLAPELDLAQIRAICKNSPIETIVYAHGHLCFSRAGQCYMGAFSGAVPEGGSWCADLCRQRFDLGGRLDDYPLSMKDLCLLDHVGELADADVTCVAIEGHDRSAEYVAFATNLYARRIGEHVAPTAQERQDLQTFFSPNGITDAYLTGDRQANVFAPPADQTHEQTFREKRDLQRIRAEIRKKYINEERRRVPLTFYAVIQEGQSAAFAAEDARGNRAVVSGFEPVDLGRPGIPASRVRDILYRTAGTPYACREVHCRVDERLDYPEEAVESARKELIAEISALGREIAPPPVGEVPPLGEEKTQTAPPEIICQVTRAEQLSKELAYCEPDRLYVPLEIAAEGGPALDPFRTVGVPMAAVLPRAVNESEMDSVWALAERAREQGFTELVGGSLGYVRMARELGMGLRGDYGLNAANSRALEALAQARLLSATVSPELSMKQIEALTKPLDTEMIVYGRMPVMVSERCIIRASAERCACGKPVMMYDRNGEPYPVLKEFGCRNVIFDKTKIFLADRPERYGSAGLWAVRLLFSAESARECVQVLQRYKGRGGYEPNGIGRGLYGKGML